ncbi:hypothetical protein GCM10022221_22720 [Actinocorallia aurea]
MAYCLTFFCRSGAENGAAALARLLAEVAEDGAPLLVRRDPVGRVAEVDCCDLATDDGSGRPASGWLILSGATDWPLVHRLWAALATLWSAVAWDEQSGFALDKPTPTPT